MDSKYNENEVVAQLQKKHDVSINGKRIEVLRGSSAKCDIGIKSKGKIDYLVGLGYQLMFTTKH